MGEDCAVQGTGKMGEIVLSEGQTKWARLHCQRGSYNGGECAVQGLLKGGSLWCLGAVKMGEIVLPEGQEK